MADETDLYESSWRDYETERRAHARCRVELMEARKLLQNAEKLLRFSIEQYEGHGYRVSATMDSSFGAELQKIRKLLGLPEYSPPWNDEEIVSIAK